MRKISQEKKSSGLGLYHAKRVLEKIGGKIVVSSKISEETEFVFTFPKINRPNWFKSEVNITGIESIVVIDDEPVNFLDWKERPELQSLRIEYVSDKESLLALKV